MRRIRTVLVLPLVLLCAFIALSPAVHATNRNSRDSRDSQFSRSPRSSRVFGPVQFKQGSFRPLWAIHVFHARRPSPGTLRLVNGGEHNQFRPASRANVWVNGERILSPLDFTSPHGGQVLERRLQLKPWNYILVEINSGAKAGFTITIDANEADTLDKIPPVITGTPSPAPNSNGWNNSNVTVSFTCSDAQSGIESCSGPETVTNEGADQSVTGTARDKAGNTASATVHVSLDKGSPSITAAQAPAPNAAGWNNGDVTVSFTCSDDLSGIATCSSAQTVTTDGANRSVSGTAADRAGNSSTVSASVNLDKTPPVLSISQLPETVTDAGLDVTGTATDALSGLHSVTCNGQAAALSGNTFSCSITLSEGSNTIDVAATDNAGNSGSRSASVMLSTFVPPPNGPVAISWMNPSGVQPNGNHLSKSSGVVGWNAGAVSREVLRDGNGFVEFSATETNTSRVLGLGAGDVNQDLSDVDYGFVLRNNATLAIYESGQYRGDVGGYGLGDRMRVEVRYGVVRYLRNGALLYTSGVPVRYPLRVDTSIHTPGGTVSDVRLGTFVWTGTTGVSISGETLTKTFGAGWNAGAFSANSIESGDGHMEFTAVETNTLRAAGLAAIVGGNALADIRFGVQLNANGTIEVVEGGTSQGVFGTYSGGDRFRIELQGGVVRYFRNRQQFHTSVQTPVYPLRADSALHTTGATLADVTLEPMAWTAAHNVYPHGATLIKTSADGWNGSASSATTIDSGDGYIEFTAIETNTRRGLGLKWSRGTPSQPPDYHIALNETGTIEILESGTARGQFGQYQNGDRFRVEIADGSVRYLRNGGVFYTSAVPPSYPLRGDAAFFSEGATLFDVAMGDLVWTNDVNVRPQGRTLLKTSSTTMWNAGAASTRTITAGSVEVTASESSTSRMVGLGSGNPSQPFENIEFAILLRSDTRVGVYESGVFRGYFGTYTAGDRLRVELQSGVIRYLRNGTVFYTSLVSPSMPLRVDAGEHEGFATLYNIVVR